MIVEALVATKGETTEVREAEDAVTLADAENLSGEQKLKAFAQVASRGGSRAGQAAQAARTAQLREIQQAIDGRNPVDAVANIDRWFPNWKSDPQVSAKRALADDVAYSLCADAPCRFVSATGADSAWSTPERAARAKASREEIMSSLSFSEVPGESQLGRLQRLRSFITVATQPAILASGDAEIAVKAKAASEWASSERARVALLNADEPVASELLQASFTEREAKIATATVDGIAVSLSLDIQKKCRGIYMVGATPGARQLDANAEATHLLSQAVGHPAVVKPVSNGVTSRWSEGAIPVLARWKDGSLVELRVGDATP